MISGRQAEWVMQMNRIERIIRYVKVRYWTFKRYVLSRRASHKLGLRFTRKSDVYEVIHKKIYSQFPDFIPNKDDVVVDIGAQYGDYSILCEKVYGVRDITCFEPVHDSFTELQKNLKLNKCYWTNPIEAAIGKSREEVFMYLRGRMLSNLQGTEYSNNQYTPLGKFDFHILDEYMINSTLVKIDVEGYEMDVLEGMYFTLIGCKPKLIIEIHSSDLEKKCTEYLKELGYTCKHVSDVRKGDSGNVANYFFDHDKRRSE